MNFARLKEKARDYFGNISTSDYSAAKLSADLNEGYFYLCRKLADVNPSFFEEQNVKFNLVANSSLYSLPSDFLRHTQTRLAYSTPTSPSSYKIATNYDMAKSLNPQLDEESVPTSNPIVDITNNYQRIKPTPSANVANGGILFYVARPSGMALSADVPLIPLDYHPLIAVYGAREMAARFGSPEYSRLDRDLKIGVQEMQASCSDREDKAEQFTDPRHASVITVRELT